MTTKARRSGLSRSIREFFRDEVAGRVESPSEARNEIVNRFGISNATWYKIRPDLEAIFSEHKRRDGDSNGQVVQEPKIGEQVKWINLPTDLPEAAKEVVNQLLGQNQELEHQLHLKDVEIGGMRAQLAKLAATVRVIKNINSQLTENL